MRTCWQESSRRRRGFVDDLPGVTAVTEAECGGGGAGGDAGALISSPSRTYKVFVTGAAISVLSEVGLDTPGALLGHRAGHPSSVLAQCWSPQHSHMACKLQPGELLGGSSATSNHCHLHTSINFQGCWLQHRQWQLLTVGGQWQLLTVGGSPRIPVPADMPCGGTQNWVGALVGVGDERDLHRRQRPNRAVWRDQQTRTDFQTFKSILDLRIWANF